MLWAWELMCCTPSEILYCVELKYNYQTCFKSLNRYFNRGRTPMRHHRNFNFLSCFLPGRSLVPAAVTYYSASYSSVIFSNLEMPILPSTFRSLEPHIDTFPSREQQACFFSNHIWLQRSVTYCVFRDLILD